MTEKMSDRRGFTLIELLLVVAIIGILAAIAIPSFTSYRARAYNATCAADLKSLRSHLESYFVENNQYP